MKRIFPILGLTVLLSAVLITLAITGETAKDPVCGMEVSTSNAAFTLETPHGSIYFCSQSCKDKFQANPAAYTPAMQHDVPAAPAAAPAVQAKKSGCEGCAGHARAEASSAASVHADAHGGDGKCGNTKIKEINEFHTLMMPLEAGEGQANVALIKSASGELVARKNSVMSAECPDGKCTDSFKAIRMDFGQKVDALHVAVQSGDDSAIASAFKEMHSAYEALDMMAR